MAQVTIRSEVSCLGSVLLGFLAYIMPDKIRKMIEAVSNSVDFLKRIKIGDLTVSGLNRGEIRKLSPEEINYLLFL